MTLDELQATLRAIWQTHVERGRAINEAWQAEITAFMERAEVKALALRQPAAFDACVRAEIERMKVEFDAIGGCGDGH